MCNAYFSRDAKLIWKRGFCNPTCPAQSRLPEPGEKCERVGREKHNVTVGVTVTPKLDTSTKVGEFFFLLVKDVTSLMHVQCTWSWKFEVNERKRKWQSIPISDKNEILGGKICKSVLKLDWSCLHNGPPLLINCPAY